MTVLHKKFIQDTIHPHNSFSPLPQAYDKSITVHNKNNTFYNKWCTLAMLLLTIYNQTSSYILRFSQMSGCLNKRKNNYYTRDKVLNCPAEEFDAVFVEILLHLVTTPDHAKKIVLGYNGTYFMKSCRTPGKWFIQSERMQ